MEGVGVAHPPPMTAANEGAVTWGSVRKCGGMLERGARGNFGFLFCLYSLRQNCRAALELAPHYIAHSVRVVHRRLRRGGPTKVTQPHTCTHTHTQKNAPRAVEARASFCTRDGAWKMDDG